MKTLLLIFGLTFILNATEEKVIFDQWIDTPRGGNIQKIKKVFFKTIISDLKANYTKAYFIGILNIKKFKVNKYNKNDLEKVVTYLAEIKQVYKGSDSEQNIKFNIRLEIEESIYIPHNEELLVLLYKEQGILYIDKFLILPPQKYFLSFLEKYASLKLNENYTEKPYWGNITYNQWHKVPLENKKNNTYSKIDSNILSHYIKLYHDANFIGVLKVNRYKKVHCDTESGDCGIYQADVLDVFKGDKKIKKIIFEDDFTNSPEVYANKAIYILYKFDGMYYQDEFIQISPTKEWIDFVTKLSDSKVEINNKNFKSLYAFCKATSIKESEIRALNPWINKKATNIPPNAEIIIPNINKEENNESK